MKPSILVLVDAKPPRWVAWAVQRLRTSGIEASIEREPERAEGPCAQIVRTFGGAALRTASVEDAPDTPALQATLCIDLRAAAAGCTRPLAPETWYFEFGKGRDGLPAFDDALSANQSVEVRLVARRGVERRELRYGRFPYASRYARTLDRIFAECLGWLEQEIVNAQSRGGATVLAPSPMPRARISAIDLLSFLAFELRRFTHHAWRYLFEEVRWDVAVTNMSLDRFISDPRAAWLHWVARDGREFLADPFLTAGEDGSAVLLCETQNDSRTSIVSIDLDDRFGERRPLLDGHGPASYPYVFHVDGQPWLLPEQTSRGRVEAYRLDGTQTDAASLVLEGIAAADPTIVQHEGRWWLFCTDQRRGPNYALRLYWSDSPRGPWHAHLRNPAKIDVAGARPGGTPFVRDGVLYRPAQDCTGRYGHAIAIHRVDVLTPERFEEACVARIDASMLQRKGPIGVHTLSHGHGWVAIDAQFARWSLRKPLFLLKGHLRERRRMQPYAEAAAPA